MNWKTKVFKFVFIFLIVFFFGRALYLLTSNKKELGSDLIAAVSLEGIIYDADDLISKLKKLDKDSSVKGIILKINSPGGAVAPSQELYQFLKTIKKPVYASMGSLAASGGYYAAAGCDKIYAMPGSITGSIGVIIKFTDLSEIYDKLGVKIETIKSGKYKDVGSSSRPMNSEERGILQSTIDDVYQQFVTDIISMRKIQMEKLLEYADGRIMSGNEAKKIGLVDSLGSYQDAFNDMKKELKLKDAEIYDVEGDKALWEKLLEESLSTIRKMKGMGGLFYLYEG